MNLCEKTAIPANVYRPFRIFTKSVFFTPSKNFFSNYPECAIPGDVAPDKLDGLENRFSEGSSFWPYLLIDFNK